MEELKKQIVERFGIDESKVDGTIQMVLAFVKDKLPESMRGMVDSVLSGNAEDGGNPLDSVKSALGGFLK